LEAENGISFTEFSYQLLQAYDFAHLHREHDCRVQLGGSDQWGNIVAGIDLIKRQSKGDTEPAFGVTLPLLTNDQGQKLGKSVANAAWLDSRLTSVYEFYQVRSTASGLGRTCPG
jgi:tyrosyl-tRNA synthetase